MKKLDVLILMDFPYDKPRGYDYLADLEEESGMVYAEVKEALESHGHCARLLGIHRDIRPLLDEIAERRPDVVFNLADIFNDTSSYDKNIAALLQMLGVTFTGASPEELFICNNKALSKKILSYHRIRVPAFITFRRGLRIGKRRNFRLPMVVKPMTEEASRGISLASVVDSEEALVDRVEFIHDHMHADAIAEEYVDGREFYVSILGDNRLTAFPLREMRFGQMPEDEPRIATYKAKWDRGYRKRWGIGNVFAGRLPDGWEQRIVDMCKRAYRALDLRCYARVDVRVTPEGQVYVIEVNANPNLERKDEFESSADRAGLPFDKLVERIVSLAVHRAGV